MLPGQRRIHMAKEGTRRRWSLLSVIASLDVNSDLSYSRTSKQTAKIR